ncbi:MAG: glycosyltransferase [Oscillospiraceae bacterium]|nr:glycosyltransferase [Oscillospiraceae bacterium]
MKVIQINCVYPQGSTGQITQAIHHHLRSQGIASRVIYGRGPKCRGTGVRKLCPEWYAKASALYSRLSGQVNGGCLLSTLHLLYLLNRERPDVVHLQCLNGNFVNGELLLSWLKHRRIKTVLTLHAEFPYTGGCAHSLNCDRWRTGCGHCPRWRQETGSFFRDGTAEAFRRLQGAYRGFEKDLTVVSVSSWLQNRAARSPMLGAIHHEIIQNGVDTSCFSPKTRKKTGEKTRIFHATPLFSDDPAHLKGGWYVLALARRLEDATIFVAGKHKLSGPVPSNVVLLGDIRERSKMAEQYALADMTLLTSRGETFSMVTAESLCCGTPVVGFRCGGPEEIALPDFSQFVDFGDIDALEAAVKNTLNGPQNREKCAVQAADRYDLSAMLGKYTALYRRLADENAD